MLAFVITAVTLGIFAYERYDSYEEYYHDHGYEYYIHDYEGYRPEHYGDSLFVTLGNELVYFGDLNWYDYHNNLVAFGDYIYYIDETSYGIPIQPLLGTLVTLHLNGGNPPTGEQNPILRTTNHIDAANNEVWIGTAPGDMPNAPSRPGYSFMGWNTQADGWGDNFTGETRICIDNGFGTLTPFTVYAVWGVAIHFSGNPIALTGVGDNNHNPGDTNNFSFRTVPVGWTVNETIGVPWIQPPNVWPRDLTSADRAGHSFGGWYSVMTPTGGEPITANTRIYEATPAFARWIPDSNFVVTFDPTQGAINPGATTPTILGVINSPHTNTRNVRYGWSIFDSSTARPGFPSINENIAWARSAPQALLANMTLEGWWTGHDGTIGTGSRFTSPGGDHMSWLNVPTPMDWSRKPVYSNMTVYANWVYRVSFHTNDGHVVLNSQPVGFYDFHLPGGGDRWDSFHPGNSFILHRDIPFDTPLANRTIAQNGQQYNYDSDQMEPRTYFPDGERPVGFTQPATNCVGRIGHLFNGWWNVPLPPLILVGPPGSQTRHYIDPRDPSTLIGTQWENVEIIEITRYSVINASIVAYAHWIPNADVVLTFDIGEGAEWYRPHLQANPGHPAWANNPPIPLGTNDLYHLVLTGDSSVASMTPVLSMPPHPRKPGYIMLGWFTNPPPEPCPSPGSCAPCANPLTTLGAHGHWSRENRGYVFLSGTPVAQSITVYAHWVPYITFIFDGNGATRSPAGGGGIGPYVTRRIGYGWATDRVSGNPNRQRRISWDVMRSFGYTHAENGAANGPTNFAVLPLNTGLEGFFVRPGFRTLRVQGGGQPWMRPAVPHPTNSTLPALAGIGAHSPRNNSAWNGASNGTHEIWGTAVYTDLLFNMDLVNNNREVRFYLQWGVPITFNPVDTIDMLNPFVPRVITVPVGYTFENMHEHRHMPPLLTSNPGYPLYIIPDSQPLPVPNSAPPANYNNTRDLTFPNPVVDNTRHWVGISQGAPPFTTLGFRGWYPTFSGAGTRFQPSHVMPQFHQGELVSSLYGQWGDSITFMVGNHPNPASVTILAENLTRPFTPGVSFTLGSELPPAPNHPIGPTHPVFIGWRTGPPENMMVLADTSLLRMASFNLYAVWGHRVNLVGNAPDATLGGTYTTGTPGGLFAGLNTIAQPTRPGEWGFNRRWNTHPSGSGTTFTPSGPLVPSDVPPYLYAQWEGSFVFSPGTDGTIPAPTAPYGYRLAANGDAVTWVTEGFSITTNTHIAGPPTVTTPSINWETGLIPTLPNNPTHSDPSMVFMGWRIASGQPLFNHPTFGNNAVLTRAQVATIPMNGLMNPAGPADGPRNAPTGRIFLEAVWHQRLVFHKTGELVNADNTRDGAIFEVRRFNAGNWDVVQTGIVSGAALPAVGTAASEPPFAPGLPASPAGTPHGRVAMTLPLTPGGQYRIFEVLPPLGYQRESGHWEINLQTGAGVVDSRITNIVTGGQHANFLHGLTFIDLNAEAATTEQRWHVGNRRPRLTFTKHDRDGNPLNGVIFTVERRSRSRANSGATWSPWADWSTVYTAEPSGSAIPMFPGQVTPITPTAGVVVITRPFTPLDATNDTYEFEYRLREIAVPDNSYYLVPILGRWNIVVNRYSGVDAINPCTELSVVPNFTHSELNVSPYAPNNWRLDWTVGNTPTRHWPFFKGNMFHPVTNPNQFEYLPGAEFRLFVYNGTGAPAENLVVSHNNIVPSPAPGTAQPGTWSLVVIRNSNGNFNNITPEPMWFPMMPGRHYQLVETIAPVGFQVPWGQWRITVSGATNAATIQGTGLQRSEIAMGGVGIQEVVELQNHVIIGECLPHCPSDCEDPHMNPLTAFLINNRMEFDLPLTGGEGPLIVTAVGLGLAGISLVLLIAMRGKRKDKGKGKQNG